MASLDSYNQALGIRKAKHLLRRATYNYTKVELDSLSSMTAPQALAYLTSTPSNVLAEPYDPEPTSAPDGFWTSSVNEPNTFSGQYRKRVAVTAWCGYNEFNQTPLNHNLPFFCIPALQLQKMMEQLLQHITLTIYGYWIIMRTET